MTQKSEKLAKRIMEISEKEISLEEAKNIGKLVLDAVVEETMAEGKLVIIGLGTFSKKETKEVIKNVRTNFSDPSSEKKEVLIPAKIKIGFSASKKGTEELTAKYL